MLRVIVFAWAGLVFGRVLPAAAAPQKLKVSPFELAAGKIPAPDGVTVADAGEGDCALKAGSGHWTFDREKCPQLAGLKTKRHAVGDDFEVVLDVGKNLKGTFQLGERKVKIDTPEAITRIAYPGPDGWAVAEVEDGETTDAGLLAFLKADSVRDLWATDGTQLYGLSLSPTKGGRDKPPAAGCPSMRVKDWCKRPRGMREHELICVDTTDGTFEPVRFTPANHILLPNKSVVVAVRHAGDRGVEIEMEGDRGLFEATVANYTGGVLDENKQQSTGKTERCATATVASFAPRRPGNADIKIELRDLADRTQVLGEHTIELVVETTYIGAIRLGFASILGNAVDRAYEAHMAPGSSTSEIAVTETGDVNVEVVVGISAYLVDIIADKGRRYASRPTWSYFVPSPYVGVGVVTASEEGLRAIPSLHVGLEWEVSKSFAVAVNAVARRVTRLSEGYAVGSPVSATTSFTEERHEWGWALVFSVSPEFFQLAVGKP